MTLIPVRLKYPQCHHNKRTPCYDVYFVRFSQEWRLDITKIRAHRQSTFGAGTKRARVGDADPYADVVIYPVGPDPV
eukprot:15527324-Heterocapsa_arctica.AAC.1